jgi:hypothetical protein
MAARGIAQIDGSRAESRRRASDRRDHAWSPRRFGCRFGMRGTPPQWPDSASLCARSVRAHSSTGVPQRASPIGNGAQAPGQRPVSFG